MAALGLGVSASMAFAGGASAEPATKSFPAQAVDDAGYVALESPARLLDTRTGDTPSSGERLTVPVSGRASVSDSLSGVVVNVTAVNASEAGFLTVFACDDEVPTVSNLNFGVGSTVANMATVAVDDVGAMCVYVDGVADVLVDVAGYFDVDGFDPLNVPARLVDTRPGATTVDGTLAGGGDVAAGTTVRVPVTDRAGIASDATTVAMNVTAVEAADAGFATVFPCDQDLPTASNLNYASGDTVAAAVFAGVGDDGEVCIYTSASTGLLVDAFAVVPETTYVSLSAPRRIADTRTPDSTFDGEAAGSGRQPGDGTLQLEVAGRVDVPADAGSVVLTVTAVDTAAPGFMTVHPAGTGLPDTSVLNHATDDTVANTVVARVGAGGDVCVFTSATTDVVIDVAGWLPGPSAASDTGDCPATPPAALVEQWTAQLAAGQFDGAVATSGLTADEISDQFPGPTPPSGDDPVALLTDYCWYAGGLFVTPTSIGADNDAGTVTASYQPEDAQFTIDVDSDGSVAYELPPTSADQRRSSCARFELVAPTTWTSTTTSAPDSVPGVVWDNNPRPGTTPSGDVNMTWASADSMPYWGNTTPLGTHDGAGFTWELLTIEGGVQATTVADPPAGCGRYTVWTYATGSDTTAITTFLDNLQRR